MIEKYLNELNINGKAKNSIDTARYFLKDAEKFKPLDNWNKEDVNAYLLNVKERNKPTTVELKKLYLKMFFKWVGKEELVNHIKIKKVKTQLRPEDIPTIEDVNLMIETTESPMYKAAIALLFESGARISEMLPIIVGEIEETDKGMIIPVHGTKTGHQDRKVLCIFSAQYIRNLIAYMGLKKEDRLFPVMRETVQKTVIKIAENAGIEKHITPHKFRHAQATDMVRRGYQETIIRKKLGWTDGSNMIARYQHIVDDDVINATLEKSGAAIPQKPLINMKQAEQLKLADAAATITKLSTDLDFANNRIATLERKSQEVLDLILEQERKRENTIKLR